MKRYILLISCLTVALNLFAVEQEAGIKQQNLPVQKFSASGLNSVKPDSLVKSGNDAYMKGNYDVTHCIDLYCTA